MDLKLIFILVVLPWECTAQYYDEYQYGGGRRQPSPDEVIATYATVIKSLLFIYNENEKILQFRSQGLKF